MKGTLNDFSAAFAALHAATIAARKRLHDPHIGTRLKQGQFQVVRAFPVGTSGKVDVSALSEWGTWEQTVQALEGLRES